MVQDFEVKVKIAMLRKGLTGSKISQNLGISRAYFSDIIKGKRIAEHYRQKIQEILEISEEEDIR